MDDTITATYFVCDEFSKAMGLRDDPQSRMTTAFFSGNIERARLFLSEYGYMKTMLSKSRLNRRLHGIEPSLWEALFSLLAEVFKERDGAGGDSERNYVVDSLPVPVCDNIRIRRCRIYPLEERGKAFRGYIPSKRRYFYGLRVHLLASGAGEPVEFSLAARIRRGVRAHRSSTSHSSDASRSAFSLSCAEGPKFGTKKQTSP